MTPPKPYALRAGLFIVFEGLDGAGKTTQVHRLCERLRHNGYGVVPLKEPTDGPWGQKIRRLALHGRQHIPLETELTWFLEDRRQDVEHNIKPALARGDIVVLDRYYFSTIAYQGARGGNPDSIRQHNEAFAPPPDLLFLLDIAPTQGLQRIQQQRLPDEFERLEYLEHVAALFAQMDFPYLQRIPATLAPEAIHCRIWRAVQVALDQRQQHDHQRASRKAPEL
jgi:dTMP kinase